MRYDEPIYFLKVENVYDPESGNYLESETRKLRFASVMDTSRETMIQVYGGIRKGSLSIQLQNHYEDEFDYIRVDGVRYRVDYERQLRVKHTFIVSEVK